MEYVNNDNLTFSKTLNAMIGKRFRDVQEDFHNIIEPFHLYDEEPKYSRNSNTLFVCPAYLMPPAYDNCDTDALRHAMLGSLIGRQMTKGFDNIGAGYLLSGAIGNWWTEQDQMRHINIRDNLVYCYQNIPIGYGYYQNATSTIEANTIDCGGLTLAMDAYTTLLKEQGS